MLPPRQSDADSDEPPGGVLPGFEPYELPRLQGRGDRCRGAASGCNRGSGGDGRCSGDGGCVHSTGGAVTVRPTRRGPRRDAEAIDNAGAAAGGPTREPPGDAFAAAEAGREAAIGALNDWGITPALIRDIGVLADAAARLTTLASGAGMSIESMLAQIRMRAEAIRRGAASGFA